MANRNVGKQFTQALGALLAGQGFVRAGRRHLFHHWSPAGDAVLVEMQRASGMGPGTVGFYLNIGLVLGPMWEASKRRRALSADDLPATTDLLRFDRLRVPGPDREETWLLTERTLPDMIDLLERAVEEQLPAQLSVLDRETTLRNPEGLFKARAWRYRAWILADAGPSQELDDLLTWPNPRATTPYTSIQSVSGRPREPPPRGGFFWIRAADQKVRVSSPFGRTEDQGRELRKQGSRAFFVSHSRLGSSHWLGAW